MSDYDLSSLRHCTIAGEALNPAVFDAFLKQTGIKLMEDSARPKPPLR